MTPIRVLVADDYAIVRQALIAMLRKRSGLAVVGEARNGRLAAELARDLRPDVAILPVLLSELNGMEAARQIRLQGAGPRVVMVSARADSRTVMDAFRAGASAYVLQSSAFPELDAAVRAAHSGQCYLSPPVTAGIMADILRRGPDEPNPSVLTPREAQVLQLVAEGRSSKEIAKRLFVSLNTVVRHRQNVSRKLRLRSVAELTRYAIREGMVALG